MTSEQLVERATVLASSQAMHEARRRQVEAVYDAGYASGTAAAPLLARTIPVEDLGVRASELYWFWHGYRLTRTADVLKAEQGRVEPLESGASVTPIDRRARTILMRARAS
jgi:hypothetical protein